VSKDTATIVAPLLAALITGIVQVARREIKVHTRDILSELDWLWEPDGRHVGEFNRALRIYREGTWAFIFFGGVALFLCYALMAALAVIFGPHPSALIIAVMIGAGMALWACTVPSVLRPAHEMAYAASPVTLRPWLAKLTSGTSLSGGSLLLILTPAVSHLTL
jgi:hypothetical protein